MFQRCPQGFRYNRDLNVCDDIDECADDTLHDCLVREGQVSLLLAQPVFLWLLNGSFFSRQEMCRNTIGDYMCESLSPASTTQSDDAAGRHSPGCPPGFRFFLVSCIDVDECAEGIHDCRDGKECSNLEGGFECVDPWTRSPPPQRIQGGLPFVHAILPCNLI